MCLKLWRRDDFVVLPWIRNGVFVPRYERNLFIDHWILMGQIICKCGFGKRNETRRFALFFFSLHGFSVASGARSKIGKWQETCYSVASRACGKWQETCYSVASRACGKWQETCYSVPLAPPTPQPHPVPQEHHTILRAQLLTDVHNF